MTSLAHLLLVACALVAPLHAASIPHLQKKIPAALPEDIKDPLPTNQEVVAPEPAEVTGNELRVKPEDIPVEVVVDTAESSVKLNEVDDEEIQRPAVDLRNPGPPQRQEHETQNPERHSDDQLKVSTIKENIERTQNLLRESFQDVSDNIQNWLYKNDDQNKIQKNIQNLQEAFTGQIQKLNDTIQAFVKPDASEPVEHPGEESQKDYKNIESRLKFIEDNFNNDVETLSAGVELVASLRSSAGEGEAIKEEAPVSPDSSSSPAPPANPPAKPAATTPLGIFMDTVTAIRNGTIDNLNSFLALFPGGSNQGSSASNPPANTQADAPASTASGWPFNIGNPITSLQSAFSNFTQNLQSNNVFNASFPNLQPSNLSNLFGGFTIGPNWFNRPGATVKPAEAVSGLAADNPASKPQVSADKPAIEAAGPAPALAQPASAEPAAAEPAAAEPAQPGGPIRQFLNNIPVVQRIQSSITNRDTPRVPVEKSDGQSKGGWFGPPKKPGGSGDNNDSGVSLKSEEVKEAIKEESMKEESIKEDSKKEEEVRPESVAEKTE